MRALKRKVMSVAVGDGEEKEEVDDEEEEVKLR